MSLRFVEILFLSFPTFPASPPGLAQHAHLARSQLSCSLSERDPPGGIVFDTTDTTLTYGAWTCHLWCFPPDIFKCFLMVSVSFLSLVTKSDKNKKYFGAASSSTEIFLQIKISINQERKFRTLPLQMIWVEIIKKAECSVVIPAIQTAHS